MFSPKKEGREEGRKERRKEGMGERKEHTRVVMDVFI